MLKSFLLFIIIGAIGFGTTCGGTFLSFVGLMGGGFSVLAGVSLIIVGLVTVFILLKKYLWVYAWRYIGIFLIVSFLVNILMFLSNIVLLPVLPLIPHNGFASTLLMYIIYGLIYIVPTIANIYIFHFYRIKHGENDLENKTTLWSDIQNIYENMLSCFWIKKSAQIHTAEKSDKPTEDNALLKK